MDTINKRAIEMILLLSSNYKTQVESFPDFVFVPDEIVFETEDIVNLLSKSDDKNEVVYRHLKLILDMFDGIDDKEFWTLDAMESDGRWEEIREKAREIVKRVSISYSKPNLFWLTYMKAKNEK